jgi:hypothetical protein
VTKSKKKTKAELRRQSTLTQMPWLAQPDEEGFQVAYDSDVLSDCVQETDLEDGDVVEEVERAVEVEVVNEDEKSEEDDVMAEEEETEDEEDEHDETIIANPAETQLHQPTQPHQLIRGYDPADQDWEGYADGMEAIQATPKIKQEPISQVVPSSQPPPPKTQPMFKTPQKPIKHEIPSSQSPPSTPLTLSQLSYHRTPLKELNRNTVSIRDNTPSRRASSQQIEVDETENLEPVPSISKFSHQLMTPAEEEGHVRLLPEASPSPVKRPRFDSGPVFARPSKVSIRPAVINDSQDVEDESQFTAYYTPTSSPVRAAAAVRSSQATTVDMTQPSARRSSPGIARSHAPSSPAPLPNHANDSRRSSETTQLSIPRPPPFPSSLLESQFPTALSSQLPVAWEPLSDIQNTADIKTVSQLAGSLMWDTQGL